MCCAGVLMRPRAAARTSEQDCLDRQHRWPDAFCSSPWASRICTPVTWRRRRGRRALALVRERQEHGHEAHALRLLGDIAAAWSLRRAIRPEITTGQAPSTWPRNWACARSRPTATVASAPYMPPLAYSQKTQTPFSFSIYSFTITCSPS